MIFLRCGAAEILHLSVYPSDFEFLSSAVWVPVKNLVRSWAWALYLGCNSCFCKEIGRAHV